MCALVGVSAIAPNISGDSYLTSDTTGAFHFGLGLDYAPTACAGLTIRLAYQGDNYSTKTDQQQSSNNDQSEQTYPMATAMFYLGLATAFNRRRQTQWLRFKTTDADVFSF